MVKKTERLIAFIIVLLFSIPISTGCSPKIDVEYTSGGNLLHTYSIYIELPKDKAYLKEVIKGYFDAFSQDLNINVVDDRKMADTVIKIVKFEMLSEGDYDICNVEFKTTEYTGTKYEDKVKVKISKDIKKSENVCVREFVKAIANMYNFPYEVKNYWNVNDVNSGDN